MQTFPHCSQYYPYAGKDKILCSGDVHKLTVQREISNEPLLYSEDIEMLVCTAHKPSFDGLAQRENYRLLVTNDEVIGEIAPQSIEGKPPRKEQE